LPTAFLSGTAAAGGIALINAVGNLGGFVGPFLMGWLSDLTGSYAVGLRVLAGAYVLGALIALALTFDRAKPMVRSAKLFQRSSEAPSLT
jgi:ACS family tartrate transporter-like MFS transporter